MLQLLAVAYTTDKDNKTVVKNVLLVFLLPGCVYICLIMLTRKLLFLK